MLDSLIVGVVLVELRHGLGIARLRLVIFVLGKVDAAQFELADGLVDAVAGTLLGGKDVVLNRMHGVFTRQVQVADGVVYLVEIFLVAVVAGHVLERAHFSGDVIALVNCALLDAGVELGAVACVVAAAGAFEGLIRQVFLVEFLVELTQQEVLANLLRAFCALHCLGKVGHGQRGQLLLHIIVGKRQVGKRADALVVDLVQVDVREHIVGLTGPTHGTVTQGLPHLGFLDQVGLPTEVAADVAECRRGVQEVALHVLRHG